MMGGILPASGSCEEAVCAFEDQGARAKRQRHRKIAEFLMAAFLDDRCE
jgi:hypothetical protein